MNRIWLYILVINRKIYPNKKKGWKDAVRNLSGVTTGTLTGCTILFAEKIFNVNLLRDTNEPLAWLDIVAYFALIVAITTLEYLLFPSINSFSDIRKAFIRTSRVPKWIGIFFLCVSYVACAYFYVVRD